MTVSESIRSDTAATHPACCSNLSSCCGDPSEYCGDPSMYCGDPSECCGDPSEYCGDPSEYCGDPSVYCGEPSECCGDPSVYCGTPAKHCGDLSEQITNKLLSMTDYNLPDIQLLEDNTKPFLIWIPDKTYIVLGASNRADEALFLERVLLDGITVLKRPSGGQTVMLTPDNLIISVVYSNPKELQPKDIFLKTNSLIISALEKAGIHDLSLRGISDIAIDGKKILGSSIYRNKDSLLYHAVLNLAEPASTFEKYLRHPTKEPDYRQGRKHTDFVTSLKEKGYTSDYHQLTSLILQSMEEASLTHISTNDPTNK